MYTTSMPGKLIEAKKYNLDAGETVIVGEYGVFAKIKAENTGVVISAEEAPNETSGYAMGKDETIDFSDKAQLYNSGTAAVAVSVMIFDIV